jgi:MoaA/NifB/PqqE/SkfB family radical SAM enzyme
VNYAAYSRLHDLLKQAESLSDGGYQLVVKWSKIEANGTRSYQRCYGAPFLLQISGSGLVAPCGMLFNERYKKFHIGNIVEKGFKEIWQSARYWEVMNYLASPQFNAQMMCGALCLQHKVNECLDEHKKGRLPLVEPTKPPPMHAGFV